jgi:hypothetical protein
MSNVAAGALVDLHPNSVRLWRHRWAFGEFSLVDASDKSLLLIVASRRVTSEKTLAERDGEFSGRGDGSEGRQLAKNAVPLRK